MYGKFNWHDCIAYIALERVLSMLYFNGHLIDTNILVCGA